MNIKSLLLGSAAALLAVSGARAADAVVVAEPEPMEYVRICDVYGAGFYYIPGTETCLKIGGLVRYQIDWDSEADDGWRKTALFRLKFDARSETEYGTFKRYIEFQGSNNGGETLYNTALQPIGYAADSSTFSVRYAYFELGGLMVGRNDTLFDGDLSGEFDAGGGDFIQQIRYTFDAGNGIAVSVGLEEEDNNFDYVPLITGKVSIAQGWGSVDLFAGYDDRFSEFALKAIAKVKATDALTLELLAAYESGATWFGLSNFYAGYEWSVGGYLKYAVNDKLTVGFGGQYFADSHAGNFLANTTTEIGFNDWTVGAVIDYTIVENLTAKLALNYDDGETFEAAGADGSFNGFLRLDASF
ncbi:porin [Aminobacter anthyllidis]|uniref:Porin n=1 Tax=Aminobacter anthyllidis TaxID=1035067 RepID=A0A9X1A8D9_9HYPH|nr:porin [Aminobacter anthyllidis]MBT1155256.1 porin [Aminobacter anthyllidis]